MKQADIFSITACLDRGHAIGCKPATIGCKIEPLGHKFPFRLWQLMGKPDLEEAEQGA